jgi:hypothetical protein
MIANLNGRCYVPVPAHSWGYTPEIDDWTWELGPGDPALEALEDLRHTATYIGDDCPPTRCADIAAALDILERALLAARNDPPDPAPDPAPDPDEHPLPGDDPGDVGPLFPEDFPPADDDPGLPGEDVPLEDPDPDQVDDYEPTPEDWAVVADLMERAECERVWGCNARFR